MRTEWNANERGENLTQKAYHEQEKMLLTLKPYPRAVLMRTASAWNLLPKTDHLNASLTAV